MSKDQRLDPERLTHDADSVLSVVRQQMEDLRWATGKELEEAVYGALEWAGLPVHEQLDELVRRLPPEFLDLPVTVDLAESSLRYGAIAAPSDEIREHVEQMVEEFRAAMEKEGVSGDEDTGLTVRDVLYQSVSVGGMPGVPLDVVARFVVPSVLMRKGLKTDPELVVSVVQKLRDAGKLELKEETFTASDGTTFTCLAVRAVKSAFKAPGKSRGRPRVDQQRHRKIMDAWNTRRYRTYEDCARELGEGFTARDVKLAVGREYKRRRDAERRMSSGAD